MQRLCNFASYDIRVFDRVLVARLGGRCPSLLRDGLCCLLWWWKLGGIFLTSQVFQQSLKL